MIFLAELGINHHGDFEKAKRMLHKAVERGATHVKGQFYDPKKVLGPFHPLLSYATQCQLSRTQHELLAREAERVSSSYSVSVFNRMDIHWASGFSGIMKIATRMNKDHDFSDECSKTGLPVIMSIQDYSQERPIYNFKYMWCQPDYPAERFKTLNHIFDEKHGLSSHCPNWRVSLEAYTRGATIFENHLCESKEEQGCDIPASITFKDYARFIAEVKARAEILDPTRR